VAHLRGQHRRHLHGVRRRKILVGRGDGEDDGVGVVPKLCTMVSISCTMFSACPSTAILVSPGRSTRVRWMAWGGVDVERWMGTEEIDLVLPRSAVKSRLQSTQTRGHVKAQRPHFPGGNYCRLHPSTCRSGRLAHGDTDPASKPLPGPSEGGLLNCT